VAGFLEREAIPHERLAPGTVAERTAALLAAGGIVGWMQGRMEFGPRALGHRSILADPRVPDMQRTLNLKIKFRESFRPFAPAVPVERVAEFFELDAPSPYMLLTAPVRGAAPAADTAGAGDEAGVRARLAAVRSPLPAVTHVDGSARVQTVSRGDDPLFHALLEAFGRLSGVPVLVNTSFNVRGEPIVCTPADAYRCFMATAIDWLVIGDCLVDRRRQPATHPLTAAPRAFAPD
jgi:carbamoyltransferase